MAKSALFSEDESFVVCSGTSGGFIFNACITAGLACAVLCHFQPPRVAVCCFTNEMSFGGNL